MAEDLPILDNLPELEIEGNTYYMRRLNLSDVFKMTKVISRAANMLGSSLQKLDFTNPEILGILLVTSVPYAEKEILELLASVLQKKEKVGGKETLVSLEIDELLNPDKFPMFSVVTITEALIKHQDLKSFLDSLVGLLKNPAVSRLVKSSTSSNKDTGGKTKKS